MAHLTVAGCRIYFEMLGRQGPHPPVIFLHDGLGSTTAWNDLPQRVADELRGPTLSYDRQGYGRSCSIAEYPVDYHYREADFLASLMDSLEVDKAHLIGHSDGATIALIFAAFRTDRTLSVIAEAPHSFIQEETVRGLNSLVDQERRGELEWLEEQQGERAAELFQKFMALWLSPFHLTWDIRDCLERIKAPVLAIQGDADEFGTLDQVIEIERRVDNATSWIVPGCGHVPHSQERDAFFEQTIAHIRRVMA